MLLDTESLHWDFHVKGLFILKIGFPNYITIFSCLQAEEVLLQSAKPAVGRLATACPNMASNGNGNWTPKLTDNRRVVRATHYSNGFPILTNLLSPKKTREYRKVSAAFIIENSARVLFPLAFVSFNCAYWLRYLHSK